VSAAVRVGDPDGVVTVLASVEIEGRTGPDLLVAGNVLEAPIGAVAGLNLRREAGLVAGDRDLRELDRFARIENDSDARLLEAAVALGRPVRRLVSVGRVRYGLRVLMPVALRVVVADRRKLGAG